MNVDMTKEKKELRKQIKKKISELSMVYCKSADEKIRKHALSCLLYTSNEIQAGWDQPQFQDDAWKFVKTADYGFDNLHAQFGEPVIPVMTLSVKEVLHSPKGETILDFGQNISGRVSRCV